MTTLGARLRIATLTRRLLRHLSARAEDDTHERLLHEQLCMVWLHARVGLLVATAFAVLFAVYLRGDVSGPLLFGWLLAKVAVSFVRLVQGQVWANRGQPGGAPWRRSTHALLALDGFVWGVGGWWLMTHSVPLASLVAAILACVSCVATFGLQSSRSATAAYVVPMLLPAAVGLLQRGDDVGWIGGPGLLMLLGLQLVTAHRSQGRLAEGVLLRLKAQALAAEKDAALKLAQRQSAVKTQFLANISHELRTPLHGILGLARLLHLESRDATVAHRLELIEASGTHLLRLINDLMDASRIESGRFELSAERFELGAQIDQVAGVYAVRAGDKGLGFESRFEIERPCWVVGDPARLRQVLHNLLGNAIKFTERGGVRMLVRRAPGPQGLHVEVRDSGPGIAPGEVERVFEAFRQSEGAQGRPMEGAGLGLTISREIARAMGGDIRIDSTVGLGTTLHFTARLPPALPHGSAGGEADEAGAAPAWSAQLQVLLAEDDDVNALIATSFLERLGAQVERVGDGKAAVRHALREVRRPDLVLMDCRMPEMDGYAASAEIRRQEQTLGLSRLPIVALTATVTEADRERCLAAGMDDFLSKPFAAADLASTIARWTEAQPITAR